MDPTISHRDNAMSTLVYRAMRLSDYFKMIHMINSMNAGGLKTWQHHLSKYDCRVLVSDQVVVGVIVFFKSVEESDIVYLAIKPEWQRQGLGKHLLQSALDELYKQQVKKVFLEVRASNQAAKALYQACQFVQVGLRKNYYKTEHCAENALILSLIFQDHCTLNR